MENRHWIMIGVAALALAGFVALFVYDSTGYFAGGAGAESTKLSVPAGRPKER